MMRRTVIFPQVHAFTWKRWRTAVFYGVMVTGLAFLFLYRLDVSPDPWFDEGAFLNVAKTFAEDGVYAESSAAGYRYTGPVISTGPTVLLPIAFLFEFTGPSILAARTMVAVSAVFVFLVFHQVGKSLFDAKIAFVAAVFVLLSDDNLVVFSFRNVMGEGPGLLFLFVGLWLWLRPGVRNRATLVFTGVMLGFAGITKFQYALFILPSILCAWVLDLIWYRKRKWEYFVVPGVIAGMLIFGWAYYALFVLGADQRNITEEMDALNAAGSNAYLVFDLKQNLENLRYLAASTPFNLFIPGILYAPIISLPRNETAQRWSVLCILLLASSGTFVFSMGWSRNALPVLFFGALFIAHLISRLTGNFHLDWDGIRASLTRGKSLSMTALISIVSIGLIITIINSSAVAIFYLVFIDGDDSTYRVSEFLSRTAPDDALIETWEKELSVLSDHAYHFPPDGVETHYNRYKSDLGPPTGEMYDFRDYVTPDYVIVGSFAKLGKVYMPDQLSGYELVQSYGQYDIYQRKAEAKHQ